MVAAAAAARHSPEPLSMLAADRTRISGRTGAKSRGGRSWRPPRLSPEGINPSHQGPA